MPLHAFVVMPYGTKEDVNFDRVYAEYIRPALAGAGFDVFRADEETLPGDIRSDMFQELLIADLVVADLSIDNPNVWYELGVRHGLRARGIVQIRCRRDRMPFDVYTDRTVRYHIKDGAPDPDTVQDDRDALAAAAKATAESWHGRRISPVYRYLGYLQEPEWKVLRVDGAKEFWEKHEAWQRRIEVARQRQRPGDILVLADEAPTQVLAIEARVAVAKALRGLGQFSFALEQVETVLSMNPTNVVARQEKGILLNRLGRRDEAREWLKSLVEDHPDDAETWGLLGRVEKETWIESWRGPGRTAAQMRAAAADEDAQLREAASTYATGFLRDPRHYYSGINALTLLHLSCHLTAADERADHLRAMEGGVRWAVQSALDGDSKDYWARATLGDLELLIGDRARIERAYREAVAVADKNWFNLDSSCQQLRLLKDLEFRPAEVEAALTLFERAQERLQPPEARWEPKQVFLFSGHMIDAPDRSEARFPRDKEPIAASAIRDCLEQLGAGPTDLALCGGACGGDLLFAEACLERGVRLELRIPFPEPEFLEKSVTFAAEGWRDRFYAVKRNPLTQLLVMPDELGPTPSTGNPYERDNLWQLYSTLARGPDKVRFISLWNRKGGDGPGGTRHMHDTVKSRSGQVHVLDTNVLW